MKDNEKKRAFITARAEGKSYEVIAQELKISKSTCTKWSRDLEEDIATLKDAQRAEQIEAYKKQKEARVQGLTNTIAKIDKALEAVDFSELSPRDLLTLKLNYTRALKEEYPEPIEVVEDNTLQGILAQYNILFAEAGRISPASLKARLEVLKGKSTALSDFAHAVDSERSGPFDIDLGAEGISYNDVMLRGLTPEEIEEA